MGLVRSLFSRRFRADDLMCAGRWVFFAFAAQGKPVEQARRDGTNRVGCYRSGIKIEGQKDWTLGRPDGMEFNTKKPRKIGLCVGASERHKLSSPRLSFLWSSAGNYFFGEMEGRRWSGARLGRSPSPCLFDCTDQGWCKLQTRSPWSCAKRCRL